MQSQPKQILPGPSPNATPMQKEPIKQVQKPEPIQEEKPAKMTEEQSEQAEIDAMNDVEERQQRARERSQRLN